MYGKWSIHAWERARLRYPEIDPAHLAQVPERIELSARREMNALDADDDNGCCFVSVHLPTMYGKKIKAKFIYSHVNRTIITALPFNGRYDKQYSTRLTVGLPYEDPNADVPRSYWGT